MLNLNIPNLFLFSLLAASGALSAPTSNPVPDPNALTLPAHLVSPPPPSPALFKRKNPNKCEAHIHIDASNAACLGLHCNTKWKIDVVDKNSAAIGYDWAWQKVGTWGATDPFSHYSKIKIKTTKGLELWIEQDPNARDSRIDISNQWRRKWTLHYGNQHWNSHECPGHLFKGFRQSNGFRDEWDFWCEFDC